LNISNCPLEGTLGVFLSKRMYIHINNIKMNKYELLSMINSNLKLVAIATLKAKTDISLKVAKECIDNLEKNSQYYNKI